MPDYPQPPFAAGALTIPRQLNRWLDVNPVNKLGRAKTTITLPAFSIADEWNGYSDIVTSFNFDAPNNFSFIGVASLVPTDPNYVLCVSFRVGEDITRYLLWDATGSNLNQQITEYSGQPIKKNFRLEVWNTSQGASSQATEIVFLTSKLQGVDYRWADDAALVGNGGQVTDFDDSVQSTGATAPATDMLVQFRADTGVDGTDWTAMVDNVHVTPSVVTTDGEVSTSSAIANKQFFVNPFGANTTFDKGSLANFADCMSAYILFRINTLENAKEIISFGKSSDPTIVFSLRIESDGKFAVYNYTDTRIGNSSTLVSEAGQWYVAVLTVYPAVTAVLGGVVALTGPTATALTYELGNISTTVATPINYLSLNGVYTHADTSVAEILMYQNNPNAMTSVTDYFWTRYVTKYALPLTFPSTSVSTTN